MLDSGRGQIKLAQSANCFKTASRQTYGCAVLMEAARSTLHSHKFQSHFVANIRPGPAPNSRKSPTQSIEIRQFLDAVDRVVGDA